MKEITMSAVFIQNIPISSKFFPSESSVSWVNTRPLVIQKLF